MYRGSRIEDVNTDTPWVTQATGYPLRYLRQLMTANPMLSALDLLYMMERAVDASG